MLLQRVGLERERRAGGRQARAGRRDRRSGPGDEIGVPVWLVTAMSPAMSDGILAEVLVRKTMFDMPTHAGGACRGRPATVDGPDDPRAR